jgi:DNA-binding MarR family transcriptional regulator
MDDFVHAQGAAFLAHVLRRLADELIRGGALWYPEAGVAAPPRTTSTLLALDERGPLGVTEIASLLRQSHPLVIGWIKQLEALGFVASRPDAGDRRRSVIALTRRGRSEVQRLRGALEVMEKASQRLLDEASPGLFEALWHMESLTRRKPFVEWLREEARASDER